ncbi:glycerol-3-phosphate dehydrogenase/oxidase [Rheinheimera muenzenbergensis]|uniref:Glycerol-3-phosphate dehydrogenase/oxidase n=1 Tax=Rheinheimera muenzenbergensis TaxID=1193628 RepID=A0ABU8C6Q5_9GAMM
MKIAVIGGGINGVSSAWQLALAGHDVSLFERDNLMQATSSASSKLLHGGLRYLEQGEFRLVREALQERRWWLKKAPQLTRRLPILYPLYADSRRARWQLKIGLWLYDTFAGRKGIGRHRWLTAQQALRCSPQLKAEGLSGAYLFFDGQMDDQKLGLWMAQQCRKAGVQLFEHSPVQQVATDGRVLLSNGWQQFDRVVNVAGPWSQQLLQQSGLAQQPLDLVRGSHLLLPPVGRYGHMLEVPGEARIVFVLPYQGQTLLGTTEVRQQLNEAIKCSNAERDYLLGVYNHYFHPAASVATVLSDFAGVRPLLGGSASASKASREYQLNWQGRVLTVSGGKWTTARALGRQVSEHIGRSVRKG